MSRLVRRLAALGALGSVYIQANAFSFSYTSPVQCDDLTVTWMGGTAPFYLFVTPFYSTLQNITIPDSAFNGTHGSFTTTLRVTGTENQGRFLLTMSDATGVGTGGTSGVLTAGTGSGNCNTTDPDTPFTYSLVSSLQQCQPYVWNDYGKAVQPITITGFIPLGKTFVLRPPQGNSYTWTTNIASGTNVVFTVSDAQGRQGGVSDLYTVSASGDSSCINSDSPSSTAQSATTTAAGAPTGTATATATPSSTPSNNSNAAVIGSSIAGGTVFLAAVASLIWFFLHKNKRSRDEEDESSIQGFNAAKRRGRSVDLLPDDHSGAGVRYPLPSPHTGDPLNHERGRSVYDPDPYVLPPPALDAHSYFAPTEGDRTSMHNTDPGAGHTRVTSMGTSSSGMTKAQMAAASTSGSMRSHGPQRFILHTDAGEVDDDEVVELPPMYTQVQTRRTPLANPPSTAATPGSNIVDDPLRS